MTSHLPRLTDAVRSVRALVGDGLDEAEAMPPRDGDWSLVDSVHQLNDTELQSLLSSAGSGRAEFDRVISVAAGEVAKRSRRELGHSGLAQSKGHRSAVQLVQVLTGESPSEARRQVRVGELLGETAASAASAAASAAGDGDEAETEQGTCPSGTASTLGSPAPGPWQLAVTDAINSGLLGAEIGHLIIRTLEDVSSTCTDDARREGAAELVQYAATLPGGGRGEAGTGGILHDDVRRRARQVRDRIDVDGVEDRFTRRYEKRSFKTWRDAEGALNFHGIADDEAGVFLTQMFDLALSPRRGGPRFVSKDDTSWADALLDDPRSNEQLMFDTFMQIVHAGSACDEKTIFRGERPGVRVVTVAKGGSRAETGSGSGSGSGSGRITTGFATGSLEGSDDAVPAAFVASKACDCGTVPITVDRSGRALNLGRTQRTFTPAQRVVLRTRDGGCLWPGCDRPAWQTEAHHINEWDADHGRTDVADGVLLCRFHHLNLHTHRWRIRWRGTDYELIPPPRAGLDRSPISLRSKAPTWEQACARSA